MKVICLSSWERSFYKIKCDNGEEKHFQSDRFRELTLVEKRELKINDILEL